jgi:hypothetical protein
MVTFAVVLEELAAAGAAPDWEEPSMVLSQLVSAGSGLIG